MVVPASRRWVVVDEVDSTQRLASEALARGDEDSVFVARHQTAGRGRFDRPWVSAPGSSLAASILFRDYADHPRPWLIGMTLGVAAAAVMHCQIRWPNDLTAAKKKLGGILTELVADKQGRKVPVIGLGLNLGPIEFPIELKAKATTLSAHFATVPKPEDLLRQILHRAESMPEPNHWRDLEPIWMLFDDTPGKDYRLPTGEIASALGIGPEGELIASVEGESTTVMAADAIFG